MSKYCKGCGALLQTENPQAIGYSPKADSEYCQRCYRLIHYDDLTMSMKTGIPADEVMDRIADLDCLVLWVVDLFDFEAGMIPGLNRKLVGKDIIMVASKRDILPETLSPEKTARFVFGRLKEEGIAIKALILTAPLKNEGIEEVKHAVELYAKKRPVVVMGRANSGKSTLLNGLLGHAQLTASRYPGTTLDFNKLEIDGFTYLDTPGIELQGSLAMAVDEKDLKQILPRHTLKPQVYQLRGDQSFAIGGLVRLDCIGCDHASCVWYINEELPIHRSKVENADAMWQKHYDEMFKPISLVKEWDVYTQRKTLDKMDIVVDGLGWASVHGQMDRVAVKVPKGVHITFRKAML